MRKLLSFLILSLLSVASFAAEQFIVKDGKPNAQIVIAAENRPRMATLAALELQKWIEKISGARLPIVTQKSADFPMQIYVGRSPETDKLGISADGLDYGAYRIVSGMDLSNAAGWLVLIGKDTDFDPEPWGLPISRKDATRSNREWDEKVKKSGLTQCGWDSPFSSGFKHLYGGKDDFLKSLNSMYGKDAGILWTSGGNELKGFWIHDLTGSMNAVHGLLRKLGARFYMPGDMGTVLPKLASVEIGAVDETVKPDFAARAWRLYGLDKFSLEDVIWTRRVGMNSIFERSGPVVFSHWLTNVHSKDEMKKAHPEYYALIGGKRDTGHRGNGTACFSSEGLIKETANFCRFIFDNYAHRIVSIWPGDGLKKCQCEKCANKSAEELVWSFTDRVAREVYKTHPNKFVLGGAYTMYKDAPDFIEKFPPNFIISISNSGRVGMNDPERWADYEARARKWASKVAPGNLLRGENNRIHIWGYKDNEGTPKPIYYPAIHPCATARDLRLMKELGVYGEDGEQSQLDGKWTVMGLEHITLYPHARLLWNADQDVDALLDEYCEKFYGPAAKQMKAVIDFAEANLAVKDASRSGGRGNPTNVPLRTALELRDLLDKAKDAAGETIYGQRVKMVISELQTREDVIARQKKESQELNEARARAPLAVGKQGTDLSGAKIHELRRNSPGTTVTAKTTFKVGWHNSSLLMEIRCEEPQMHNLSSSSDVHGGDYVAVFIETQDHSYYQIQVNPDGQVSEGDPAARWKSLAEIKTEKGKNFWLVKMRIPVVGQDEANSDPLHRVAGTMPTPEAPWYFNIGRVRVAGQEREVQAFSPTGGPWGQPAKFGRLEIK